MFAVNRKILPKGAPVLHKHRSMCAAVALENLFPNCGAIAAQRMSRREGVMFCELQPLFGFLFEPVVCGISITPQQVAQCLRVRWRAIAPPYSPNGWAVFAVKERIGDDLHFALLLRSHKVICEVNANRENICFFRGWEWIHHAKKQNRQFIDIYQLFDFNTRSPKVLCDADLEHLIL